MKKSFFGLVAVLVLSQAAFADGAAAYKQCAGCHGKEGEKHAMGKSKVIAQMSKADVAAALHGYKDGTYGASMKKLMAGQAAKLSDADIQAVADYIGK